MAGAQHRHRPHRAGQAGLGVSRRHSTGGRSRPRTFRNGRTRLSCTTSASWAASVGSSRLRNSWGLKVLARLWHEHTESKMYKALTLGEILCRRTWAAGGELNGLALKRQTAQSSSALKVVGDELHTVEEKEWEPKSMLTVLGRILLQFGSEDDVHAYCSWFVAKVRAQGADKLPHMQQFWLQSAGASGHALRAHIRRGHSGDPRRPAPPEKKQKPKKTPRQSRQLTEVGEDRRVRAAQGPRPRRQRQKEKGRAASARGRPPQPRRPRIPDDWGDGSWYQSSWNQGQGTGKQCSWNNAKKEDPRQGPEGLGTARGREALGGKQTARVGGQGIVLLTAFDGIGAGPHLIEQRFGRPRLALGDRP